jgi:secreted PhoX family phosphatase
MKDHSSELESLISIALSRRSFLASAGLVGAGTFLTGMPIKQALSATSPSLFDFQSLASSTSDKVIVPNGYRADVLISWGDPILSGAPQFDPSGKGNAASQAQQFGDNTDGMSCFPLSANRALMVVNNEYTNHEYLFDHDGHSLSADNIAKSQAAHGVSIFEIVRRGSSWAVDQQGSLNRRITANTPMHMTGPAAGHRLLQTKADPTGTKVLGTFSNCSNGKTPWGTYLTCEENVNYNFGSIDPHKPNAEQKRYDIKGGTSYYQWEQHDPRFDIVKNPNEVNRFGWIVEIDPMNPDSIPLKRSALGRFKHENAAITVNKDGHIVVYMGDDSKGEHIYRFISKHTFDVNKPQQNRDLLAEGTLYVARFSGQYDDLAGQGEWLELSHGKNGLTLEAGFADQAEVLIYARKAASIVGATTMDRPEWIVIHPDQSTVYCTLTNNSKRGSSGQALNGPNPRADNHYGQIIRWRPLLNDHTANEFEWDFYLLAGNPSTYDDARAGTANISPDNMFNSPDGIAFDAAGRLWILTDGKYSNTGKYAGMGNNQMLCSDPNTGEIRRFMTGPIACEVTGLCFSDDNKTLFVGIQHPGEGMAPSHFPAGGHSKPRSSIMMIHRENGQSFAQ